MPLREFSDSTGRRWRVWDIRPEEMHAATRAEDHLQAVINGWLAFEPAAGGEKRRLAPVPVGWDSATDAELEAMLERAEHARSEPATPRREFPGSAAHAGQPVHVDTGSNIRTFRYPNGRYWTVNELPSEATGTSQGRPLLRFTSGARSLDAAGPSEWRQMSEGDLADLLYQSFPREGAGTNPTEYRRRRGDIA